MCKFYKKLKNGFTLIELLIVIVLLGILSGVLYSVINPEAIRNIARDSIRMSNVRKLVEAVEAYANLEGAYPSNEAILSGPSSIYVAVWPDGEPVVTDNYVYIYNSSADSFRVYILNSESTYFLYSSEVGKIMNCPGTTYTSSCVDLD